MKPLKIWVYRNRFLLVSSLLLLDLILIVLILIKNSKINNALIVNNQALINFLSESLKTLVFIILGVFSYIKFFKGHVFSPKLNIELKAQSFEIENKIIHILFIEIENKGHFSLHDPKVVVHHSRYHSFRYHSQEGIPDKTEGEPITLWSDAEAKEKGSRILLPNDSIFFDSEIPMDKNPQEFILITIEVIISGIRVIKKIVLKNIELNEKK